jgi:hypothetical protein
MSRILINNAMWKSVENLSAHSIAGLPAGQPPDSGFDRGRDAAGPPLGACSACAGDYEDPDRTAWPPATEEEDEGAPQVTPDARPGANER